MFKKATKKQSNLRMAIIGPSGSGKTYTSLRLASYLAAKEDGRVAVIDTERGSAAKYADQFEFDVLELDNFNPLKYIEAMSMAAKAGYKVVVVDSLSHAWMGKDGALELVEKERHKSSGGNSFAAWRNVTPIHNELVDSILRFPGHVFTTMRVKTEYVQEKDDRGKTTIKKVGLAPVQRDGMEYEFDIIADMNNENFMHVSKSRCPSVHNEVINKPGNDFADKIYQWLRTGEAVPEQPYSNDGPWGKLVNVAHVSPPFKSLDEVLGGDYLPGDEPPKKTVELPQIPKEFDLIPDEICNNVPELRPFKGKSLREIALDSIEKIKMVSSQMANKAKKDSNKKWFEAIVNECMKESMMRNETKVSA